MNAKEICDLANGKTKHDLFFKDFFIAIEEKAKYGEKMIYYTDKVRDFWVSEHPYVHMNEEQRKYLEDLGYKVTKEERARDYEDHRYTDIEVPFMFFFKIKETKKESYTRLIKYYSITIEACCDNK